MKHTHHDVATQDTDTKKEKARDEATQAAEHQAKARDHRREAAEERREAEAEKRQGNRLQSAGDKIEAKGHELAAKGHEKAAEHDQREAAPHASSTTSKPATASDPRTTSAQRSQPQAVASASSMSNNGNGNGHLLGTEQRRRLRSRWEEIQASFIDSPRKSVSHADTLVKEATDELHSVFERDRRQLEGVWDRGDDVSTEDLRVTLQRYRSFFERVVTL